MDGQIFERLSDRHLMRRRHRFVDHIIAKRTHQRHRFGGRKNVKSNPCTPPCLPCARPHSPPDGATPSSSQRATTSGSASPPPPRSLSLNPTNSAATRASPPAHVHTGGTGVTFGVILRQPTISPLTVFHRIAHRPRSAVVVVHRPPRQLRHRQHAKPPIIGTRPPNPPGQESPTDAPQPASHNLCKCAIALEGVVEVG